MGLLYTSAETARREDGFLTMEEYIRRWQNTFTQYIDTRSLLDLCEGSERSAGAREGMGQWEHEGLNMAGEREEVETAAERDGGKE